MTSKTVDGESRELLQRLLREHAREEDEIKALVIASTLPSADALGELFSSIITTMAWLTVAFFAILATAVIIQL